MYLKKQVENNKTKMFDGLIDFKKSIILLILLAIFILFSIIVGISFISFRNLSNMFRAMTITGVLSLGMTLVLITGGIDLQVGSVIACCGGFMAVCVVKHDINCILAISMSLLIGLGIGIWTGFLVAILRVPPFIATLGNSIAINGLYLTIIKGETISPIPDSIKWIGQGYLSKTMSMVIGAMLIFYVIINIYATRKQRARSSLKLEPTIYSITKAVLIILVIISFWWIMNSYQGIPIPVLIFLTLLFVFSFITNHTRFGRRLYALGGNAEAAKLSGINIKRHIFLVYIINSLLAAIAGIMLTTRLAAAAPATGKGIELEAIAACVLGGVSLAGGRGTILGAVTGALIIAMLSNGMTLLNISTYTQEIIKGIVLILAVWFDVSVTNRKHT